MATLALRLAGPLQAWGSRSRFVRRDTERAPTKSGVIGMLAAAKGVRRTDDLSEFFGLRFGVRIDQPGRIIRDFQTARRLGDGKSMPLSYRYYLADAVFLAAVEGERRLLEGLAEAVTRPIFPLFLGRRSCPPVGPIVLGIADGTAVETLHGQPWQASPWRRRRIRTAAVELETIRDAQPGESGDDVLRDEPSSFDPERREYVWRPVVREPVRIPTGVGNGRAPVEHQPPEHDPFSALGE